MFRPKSLDHVVVRVAAVERCLDFYQAVLGCTLEQARPELGLYHLRAGDSIIDLLDTAGPMGTEGGPPPGPTGHNVDHFCVRIEPFDEDALRCVSCGPRCGRGVEASTCAAEKTQNTDLRWQGKMVVDEIDDLRPAAGQVLVETIACGICGSDLHTVDHGRELSEVSRELGRPTFDVDPDQDAEVLAGEPSAVQVSRDPGCLGVVGGSGGMPAAARRRCNSTSTSCARRFR